MSTTLRSMGFQPSDDWKATTLSVIGQDGTFVQVTLGPRELRKVEQLVTEHRRILMNDLASGAHPMLGATHDGPPLDHEARVAAQSHWREGK